MGKRVLVVGAGAAGLIAAWSAAINGASVTIIDKMPSPGRKLLITGAGRCNLTNTNDIDTFIQKYFTNGRFLYPAFSGFFRDDLLDLLREVGLRFTTEPNGKIFPASDKAGDVLDGLIKLINKQNVRIVLRQAVKDIIVNDGRIIGVKTDAEFHKADAVILAAGGASWPGTGSSGDGYRLASAVGHCIKPIRPALVPLVIDTKWLRDLKGISLQHTEVQLIHNGRKSFSDHGELLFTHFGLSGPVILRLSRNLPDFSEAHETERIDDWKLKLDMAENISAADLADTWYKAAKANPSRAIINCLTDPFPSRLTEAMMQQYGINRDTRAADISLKKLEAMATGCKGLTLNIAGTRGYREAMVTAGGVSLKEVDPRSMLSRIVQGLYFAGEVLDLDGDTGGYNLQAAFSTGVLAGLHAAADQ